MAARLCLRRELKGMHAAQKRPGSSAKRFSSPSPLPATSVSTAAKSTGTFRPKPRRSPVRNSRPNSPRASELWSPGNTSRSPSRRRTGPALEAESRILTPDGKLAGGPEQIAPADRLIVRVGAGTLTFWIRSVQQDRFSIRFRLHGPVRPSFFGRPVVCCSHRHRCSSEIQAVPGDRADLP